MNLINATELVSNILKRSGLFFSEFRSYNKDVDLYLLDSSECTLYLEGNGKGNSPTTCIDCEIEDIDGDSISIEIRFDMEMSIIDVDIWKMSNDKIFRLDMFESISNIEFRHIEG